MNIFMLFNENSPRMASWRHIGKNWNILACRWRLTGMMMTMIAPFACFLVILCRISCVRCLGKNYRYISHIIYLFLYLTNDVITSQLFILGFSHDFIVISYSGRLIDRFFLDYLLINIDLLKSQTIYWCVFLHFFIYRVCFVSSFVRLLDWRWWRRIDYLVLDWYSMLLIGPTLRKKKKKKKKKEQGRGSFCHRSSSSL